MKYILYSIIAFLAIVFFLPEDGSGLRNPFLFVAIACVIIFLLSLRVIKRVKLIFGIKRILASNGYRMISCRILPLPGRFDIVAEDRPCSITDRHANKEFDNGDKVCSKIVYYELKAFASAAEDL